MKKIILSVLFIGCLFFLTACGCSKKEYEVVFDVDGNRTVIVVEKGEIVDKPITPVKEGYTFVGWFKDLDDTKSYDFSQEVTSNFTLYAKWEKNDSCDLTCDEGYTLSDDCTCEKDKQESEEKPNTPDTPQTVKYTVSFDSAGGSKVSQKVVSSGNKVSKPDDPTREGYMFLGWYLNGSAYDFNAKVTKNIKLVAKWEKIETQTPEEQSELSYKIEDIKGSIVGQVRIYLTKDGEITSGNADIVTVSGKTVNKDIPKEGYITNKGIIDKVINIKVD